MAVIILTGSGKDADIREILFRGRSWTWSESKHAFVAKVTVKAKGLKAFVEGYTGEVWEQSLDTLSKGDRTLIMKLLKFAVDQEYPHHKTVTYKTPPAKFNGVKDKITKSALALEHLSGGIEEALEVMSTFKKALVKSVAVPPEFIGVDMGADGGDKTAKFLVSPVAKGGWKK